MDGRLFDDCKGWQLSDECFDLPPLKEGMNCRLPEGCGVVDWRMLEACGVVGWRLLEGCGVVDWRLFDDWDVRRLYDGVDGFDNELFCVKLVNEVLKLNILIKSIFFVS